MLSSLLLSAALAEEPSAKLFLEDQPYAYVGALLKTQVEECMEKKEKPLEETYVANPDPYGSDYQPAYIPDWDPLEISADRLHTVLYFVSEYQEDVKDCVASFVPPRPIRVGFGGRTLLHTWGKDYRIQSYPIVEDLQTPMLPVLTSERYEPEHGNMVAHHSQGDVRDEAAQFGDRAGKAITRMELDLDNDEKLMVEPYYAYGYDQQRRTENPIVFKVAFTPWAKKARSKWIRPQSTTVHPSYTEYSTVPTSVNGGPEVQIHFYHCTSGAFNPAQDQSVYQVEVQGRKEIFILSSEPWQRYNYLRRQGPNERTMTRFCKD